jgi:O-Antigen ligase
LAPASIAYLSFNQGGYFPDSTGLAAIGFAAALVLRTTLAEHPFAGYNRQLAVLVLALGCFALCQLVSALWSHETARALDEYDRTLLYLLAFALFGSLPRSPTRLRWLIRALATGMTAVCLAGLLSRVLPHFWPTAAGFYYSRLNFPLTYWNAEGLLAAVASILLIHLAASEDERPFVRVLGAAFVPATAATLLLTFSRGALAVAIIGAVVYLLAGRPRAILGAAVAMIPTTAIALHGAYAAELLASNTPTSAAAVAQGRHLAETVAWCMVAAGVLRAVTLPVDSWLSRRLSGVRGPRIPRAAVLLTGGVVVVVLVASGFAAREWNAFANPAKATTTVTRNRLSDLSGENRVALWRTALHAFRERPLLGYGAGSFEQIYAQRRTTGGTSVTDAHSLYAQTLAEQGIVGFGLLAVAVLGSILMLGSRARGSERTAYAALFAAGVAWAIHAGVDWDWEMPAVTLWLFIVAGSGLASPRDAPHPHLSESRNRTPMSVGWLVLAIAPLLIGVSYQRLRVSGEELFAGNCVKARQSAFSSISLLSARPEAYAILSFCDLQLGFPVEGLQAAQKAAHYEPNNWNYRYGLAIALGENGDDPRSAAQQALRLDPREIIVQDEVAAFAHTGPGGWEQAAPQLLVGGLQSGRLAISNL